MKRSRDREEDNDKGANGIQDPTLAPVPKIVTLDSNSHTEAATAAIQCSLPGHAPGLLFTAYEDYEKHYKQVHTNRCLECRRNFPSSYVLDLHIQENHDALAKIRREKGEPTYSCFIETCGDTFKTIRERQDHLIKSHKYPSNYFFAVSKFGIDGRKSMLIEDRKWQGHRQRRPRDRQTKAKEDDAAVIGGEAARATTSRDVPMGEAGATASENKQAAGSRRGSTDRKLDATEEEATCATENSAVDADMEDLAGAMSALRFVPRALRLGPKQKSGSVRR